MSRKLATDTLTNFWQKSILALLPYPSPFHIITKPSISWLQKELNSCKMPSFFLLKFQMLSLQSIH